MKLLYIVVLSFAVIPLGYCMSDCEKQLFQAALDNNSELAQEALNNGADINTKDTEAVYAQSLDQSIIQEVIPGMTPLQYSVVMGNTAVAQFLLDKGANALLLNGKGTHALYLAVEKNNKALVKALLDKEPSLINKQSKLGLALTRAVLPLRGVINLKLVELLLSRGASPSLKTYRNISTDNFKGRNTLEILKRICDGDSLEIGFLNQEPALYLLRNYSQFLQQAKADPNKKLFGAAIDHDYATIVEALIKAGYKVDESDLKTAKRHDRKEIGRMLIQALYMAPGPIAKQWYKQLPINIQRYIAALTL